MRTHRLAPLLFLFVADTFIFNANSFANVISPTLGGYVQVVGAFGQPGQTINPPIGAVTFPTSFQIDAVHQDANDYTNSYLSFTASQLLSSTMFDWLYQQTVDGFTGQSGTVEAQLSFRVSQESTFVLNDTYSVSLRQTQPPYQVPPISREVIYLYTDSNLQRIVPPSIVSNHLSAIYSGTLLPGHSYNLIMVSSLSGETVNQAYDDLATGNFNLTITPQVTTVPEPSSLALAGAGAIGLYFAGRKRPIPI